MLECSLVYCNYNKSYKCKVSDAIKVMIVKLLMGRVVSCDCYDCSKSLKREKVLIHQEDDGEPE